MLGKDIVHFEYTPRQQATDEPSESTIHCGESSKCDPDREVERLTPPPQWVLCPTSR